MVIWFEFGVDFLALIRIDQILNNGGSVASPSSCLWRFLLANFISDSLIGQKTTRALRLILALNSFAPTLFEFLTNENVAF